MSNSDTIICSKKISSKIAGHHHLYTALLLAYRQRHLLESAAEILGTDCNHRCQYQKTPCQNGIDGTHQEEGTEELHQSDYDCGQDIRNY